MLWQFMNIEPSPDTKLPESSSSSSAQTSSQTPDDPTGDLSANRSPSDNVVDGQCLDVRWIGLTRSANAFTIAVVAAILVSLSVGILSNLPQLGLVIGVVVGICFLAWSTLLLIWWPRWRYDAWSYRLGPELLEVSYGIVTRTSVAIPLSRVQHVDLHRGPLERRWGLASLEIHTAGTQNASHTIPGLDAAGASRLRDQLLDVANRGADERVDN